MSRVDSVVIQWGSAKVYSESTQFMVEEESQCGPKF